MKRGVWIIVGAVAVVLVVVILLLNRGGAKTPTKETLTIWSPFDESATFQTISKKFLSANSNVTLNFKYVQAASSQDYEAQVVNAIANGHGPDIWLVRSDWLPKHTDASAPAELNGSYSAAINQVKQTIIPNLVDLNTVNGKLYGMPLQADSLAIIYNQTLYNQETSSLTGAAATTAETVPASWQDLQNQMALLSQSKGSTVTRSGIALGTAGNTFDPSDVLSAFLVQAGVNNVLTKDGSAVAFNLPQTQSDGSTKLPATDALTFYTSFATPGQANYSWNTSSGDPVQAFLSGKTDALIGYYSTLQTIMNSNPSFSVEVAPLVQESSSTTPRVDYGVTWSGVVNKNSTQTALAWSYLGYLGGQSVLNQYAAAAKHLAVTAGSAATIQPELITAGNASSIFEDELPTIQSLSAPDWQFRDQTLQTIINLVVNSGQTPQTAVDSAAQSFKTQFLGSP